MYIQPPSCHQTNEELVQAGNSKGLAKLGAVSVLEVYAASSKREGARGRKKW